MFGTSALDESWMIATLALSDAGTGIIYLTGLSKGSGGIPYDTWAARIPDTNWRAGGDDPDGDGFSNREEFLFGTLPKPASTRSGSDRMLHLPVVGKKPGCSSAGNLHKKRQSDSGKAP
jgi:hypothetical protein